MIWFSDLFNSG